MNQELQPVQSYDVSTSAMIFDPNMLNQMQAMATIMAQSKVTVPKHLHGNTGDCMAIIMQSAQWKLNPFVVSQKTHITQSGALGYEAQLLHAVICANGPIAKRPKYEFIGDWTKILGKVSEQKSQSGGKYYVAAWDKKDEEGLGVTCTVEIIEKNGDISEKTITLLLVQCYPRFSTQWATDPQQQIIYAVTKKMARREFPDVILGAYSLDEIEDNSVTEKVINPITNDTVEQMVDKKTADVLGNLGNKPPKEKPPIEQEPIVTLEEVMSVIDKIDSKEAQERAKDMISKLPDADKGKARSHYQAYIDELKKQHQTKKAEEQPDQSELADWKAAIDGCTSLDELDKIESDMPETAKNALAKMLSATRAELGKDPYAVE
jgi:hypothetical protein